MGLRNIKRSFLSHRNRVIIVGLGLAVGVSALVFTTAMTRKLRDKEQYEVTLWSYAMARMGEFNTHDPLMLHIVNSRNNIPFIITDENLHVQGSNLIPQKIINHPDLLIKKISELSTMNQPLEIDSREGYKYFLFYGNSKLLMMLIYFPIAQILFVAAFVAFGFIAFRSSKQDEQNRVWIGLAKETAHQLGTPISSLMGWIEYLRSQPIDQNAVTEMNNDLTRLMRVADRFSKIGSETSLSPVNVNETVGATVLYFRTRVPKNTSLSYDGLAQAPVFASINPALFEWVIENLLKNALDALQGHGSIDVKLSYNDTWVFVDVSDTGKGIPKSNLKRIFEPGFTTKTRGWGLGLSLSRRIIEEYHKGRIAVADSEPGKGTTIRVAVKRAYA